MYKHLAQRVPECPEDKTLALTNLAENMLRGQEPFNFLIKG